MSGLHLRCRQGRAFGGRDARADHQADLGNTCKLGKSGRHGRLAVDGDDAGRRSFGHIGLGQGRRQNAGWMAVQILALHDGALAQRIRKEWQAMVNNVANSAAELEV